MERSWDFSILEVDSQASKQKLSILITRNLRIDKQQVENEAADMFYDLDDPWRLLVSHQRILYNQKMWKGPRDVWASVLASWQKKVIQDCLLSIIGHVDSLEWYWTVDFSFFFYWKEQPLLLAAIWGTCLGHACKIFWDQHKKNVMQSMSTGICH